MTAVERPDEALCLFRAAQRFRASAVELAAAVQRCGARDMGKYGVNELCPYCIEAVRAVTLRVTPTDRLIVERWMHLPAADDEPKGAA